MTPPGNPIPDDLRPDRLPEAWPPLRLHDDGELVAAIPAVLGFHPRDSLVLLAIGGESGHRLGLVLRVDLPPPEHAELDVDRAVHSLLQDSPTAAVVVVVTDEVGSRHPGPYGADPPHREVVELVVAALREQGVRVHSVLRVEGTVEGCRWAAYNQHDREIRGGLVPDPASTAYVAAAVASGRIVHADREALERLVAAADPERLRRREGLLLGAVDEALRADEGAPPAPGDPPLHGFGVLHDEVAGLSLVENALADVEAGRLVLHEERHDARVVALATALTQHVVRDAALLWCAGSRAEAAEQLWIALVRETPDPEAAEPAALLAVSALLRGDGAFANVVLERAERAWPGHRLSGLLRAAAASGVRPEELRACLAQCGSGEPARSSGAGSAASRSPRSSAARSSAPRSSAPGVRRRGRAPRRSV